MALVELSTAWMASLVVCLIGGSAISSGLQLGLLSLDLEEVRALATSGGSSPERKMAQRVLPLIADQHWLLVTLLLWNTGLNLLIPQFMVELVGPTVSIILSISLVLVIGDLLPQAICVRHGLRIGSYIYLLVHLARLVTCPISWPLARVLDVIISDEHHSVYKHKVHKETLDKAASQRDDEELWKEMGAVMCKIAQPFAQFPCVPLNGKLDLPSILASGLSTVLVHAPKDRSDILGVIPVSDLLPLLHCPSSKAAPPPLYASSCLIRPAPRVSASTPLARILHILRQANNAHIAILTNKPHSSAPLIQSNDRSAHKKGIPRSQSLPAQALGEGCEHTQQQPQSAAARQPARSCSVGDAIELTQSSKSPAVQPALPHTLQAAGSTIVRSSSSCTTTRVTTKVTRTQSISQPGDLAYCIEDQHDGSASDTTTEEEEVIGLVQREDIEHLVVETLVLKRTPSSQKEVDEVDPL